MQLDQSRREIESILDHFSASDPQQGARVYFELRIGAMLSPFVNMFEFIRKYALPPRDLEVKITSYLRAHPSLSLDGFFKMLREAWPGSEQELDSFSREMEHFAILIREFAYLFGTQRDHDSEFGGHRYRANMENFYEKGNRVAANLLEFLACRHSVHTREGLEGLADFYIRETIFTDYKLFKGTAQSTDRIDQHRKKYAQVKERLHGLASVATQAVPLLDDLMWVGTSTFPLGQDLMTYYQVEPKPRRPDPEEVERILERAQKRQVGFEIEFNSGFNGSDLGLLAARYEGILGWKNLYTFQHADMYGPDSDGLLFYDATLPERRDNEGATIGAPLEYSAPPFTFVDDGDKYTRFLHMLGQEDGSALYANSEVHQHIYARDIDLASMKRISLRRAWLDETILGAFHVPDKQLDLNRSSSALLTNISSHATEEERIRNFMIFSGLVNSSGTKSILRQRVNRGDCKYNSLNLVPGKTIEFRGMQGTFSQSLLEHYLEFNLFFVEAAIQNSPVHCMPHGLDRARRLRQEDASPRLKASPLSYHREAFDPTRPLDPEQKQGLLELDKHLITEMTRIGAPIPPDPLCVGTHQAVASRR